MKVEVLISTVNQEDEAFLDKMNLQGDFLVINQTQKGTAATISNERIITVEERGLSRSRNLAIENSNGDICLICDDDVIYDNCYEQIVLEAYENIPEADLIIFNATSKSRERTFANLGDKIRKLGKRDLLKVSSVRVSFKRQSIIKQNIRFNELFGSGSDCFSSGEENIFLFECFNKKLNIYYSPINILTKEFSNSLWFNGFNERYFFSKGALSKILFGRFSCLYNIYFVIMKYKLYKNTISPYRALRKMKSGRRFLLGK